MLCAPMGHYKALVGELVKGINAAGDEAFPVSHYNQEMPYDAFVCWGWRIGKRFRKRHPKTPICVMERGYVGDRFHWTSLGWNGLNGRAIFPKAPEGDFYQGRWHRWLGATMQPWRDVPPRTGSNRYALILGQVQADQACINVNLAYQYRAWAALLHQRGYRVKFRAHPKALAQHSGLQRASYTRGTLAEDLAGAAFTVSWNSNASVDSVLAGVPSVTFDKGAMAWDVASHDLDSPVTMPSRTEWAAQLAWCQWQPLELADGTAWKAVREVKP